jgi:DNA ligase-1
MHNLYTLTHTTSQTFYDAEARVAGYVKGKGRLAGSTGALKCEMESGKTFNVGTGLSDKQRQKPPKIGAIITYRFQELTRDGVPRFVISKQANRVTLMHLS